MRNEEGQRKLLNGRVCTLDDTHFLHATRDENCGVLLMYSNQGKISNIKIVAPPEIEEI